MPGHVRRRGKGWVYVLDLPRGDDGRRKPFWSRQFPTERDAETALAVHVAQLEQGIGTAPSRDTVGEYLGAWLESKRNIRASTWRQYEFLIRCHIVPHLGQLPLTRLEPRHIDRWHTRMLKGDTARGQAAISPTTAQMAHALLVQALDRALKFGLVNRNVAALVERPKRRPAQTTWWTLDEVRRFLRVADQHHLAAFWRLALATGMRRGELQALAWTQVDLDARAIQIEQTATRARDGAWDVGPVKTPASRRRIRIDAGTAEQLRRWRTRQKELRLRAGTRWHETGLVFTRDDGRMLADTYLKEHFDRLVDQANAELAPDDPQRVRHIRLHDLRHTAATLMLANGEPMKTISERLGHASIGITMNLYAHVTEEMQEAAAERMGQLLEGT